jgi:pimeloyl-ACP methyl ester carboxylesterase
VIRMTSLRLLTGGLTAAVAVASAAGALLAQTGGDACSARNDGFGPDTCATHVFTGQGVTPAGLTCAAAPQLPPPDPTGPPTLVCEGFLASGLDGTLLDVTAVVPPPAPGGNPLLVGMHGWGAAKTSMDDFDDDAVREGYTYLRYSARGMGKQTGSWGQANLADVNVEAADLRSLIGQVADDPRLGVDPSAVAVFGASYGGAHAWMAAVRPVFASPEGRTVQVRTVVPIATWSELLHSLAPNGRPRDPITVPGAQKLSYIEALYFSGLRADLARPYSNYPAYLHAWHDYIVASEPSHASPVYRQIVDGISGYRSVYWQEALWQRVRRNQKEGRPQLPVFALQGFTDDLFPVTETLRMVDRLKKIDPAYPIALYFGDIGHPRASNKPGEMEYGIGLILDWLAFHLKGDATRRPAYDLKAAITRPREAPFDPTDVIEAASFAGLATGTVARAFAEAAVIANNPGDTSGVRWDPILMTGGGELEALPPSGAVATHVVPVAELAPAGATSLLIAGQPRVSLRTSVLTPSYRVQLNVRLVEVRRDGSEHLVTRGTFTLDSGDPATPLGTRAVTIPTHGNLWEADAASQLRLEITNVDGPYLRPSTVPSATEISEVRLELPVR